MNKKTLIKSIILMMFLGGCSQINEAGKVFWGTSIAHLQKARVNAVSKVYNCSFNECYDAVLNLAQNEGETKDTDVKTFNVFLKDPVNNYIVLMDVPGSIDTTEVGVFFTKVEAGEIKVEITSLSTIAKDKSRDIIFKELDSRFSSK